MEQQNLPPDAANLIESTRSIGYSFEMALADIIDNSIGNNAHRVFIQFSPGTMLEDAYIGVRDDGIGMSSSQLSAAMRYGSSDVHHERDEDDLGRFGLGLKMASLSQCRQLTVITKKQGELAAARWDLDYIHETQSWSLQLFTRSEIDTLPGVAELDAQSQGTLVLWKNLDQVSDSELTFKTEFNSKMDDASQHLSLVFHRYLERNSSDKQVTIVLNGRELEPIDPFMRKNSFTQVLEEQSLIIDHKIIRVTPYIMPFASKMSVQERKEADDLKGLGLNQGLYIYRNRRLIAWGKWFRLIRDSQLRRLTRVQIDLPNSLDDYWKIDVKKSSAQIPSQVRDRLRQVVTQAAGKSERVYRYRGRKLETSAFEEVWHKVINRGKESYQIDHNHPVISALNNSLDDQQSNMLEGVLHLIENGFPYMDVYYDVANDRVLESTPIEDEETYEVAKQTIQSLSETMGSAEIAYKTVMNLAWIQDYPNVKKMLEEDYDGD